MSLVSRSAGTLAIVASGIVLLPTAGIALGYIRRQGLELTHVLPLLPPVVAIAAVLLVARIPPRIRAAAVRAVEAGVSRNAGSSAAEGAGAQLRFAGQRYDPGDESGEGDLSGTSDRLRGSGCLLPAEPGAVAGEVNRTRSAAASGVSLPATGLTLAVLPFENLSGDPDQEYLSREVHDTEPVTAPPSNDFEGAERSFRRALELNSNLAAAHAHSAWLHALYGRHDEALTEARLPTEIDPFEALWLAFLAWIHLWRGELPETKIVIGRALDVGPVIRLHCMSLALPMSSKGCTKMRSPRIRRRGRSRRIGGGD
jgi:tetratricopeptide (TPR) repeat protein